jgi:hypothetical protein
MKKFIVFSILAFLPFLIDAKKDEKCKPPPIIRNFDFSRVSKKKKNKNQQKFSYLTLFAVVC